MNKGKIIAALAAEKRGLCTGVLRNHDEKAMSCATGALLFHAGVPNAVLLRHGHPSDLQFNQKSGTEIIEDAYGLSEKEQNILVCINDGLEDGGDNDISPQVRRDIIISIIDADILAECHPDDTDDDDDEGENF